MWDGRRYYLWTEWIDANRKEKYILNYSNKYIKNVSESLWGM